MVSSETFSRYVTIRRAYGKHFQSALKIWSDTDKAKVWEKVQRMERMERQYHDDFFLNVPGLCQENDPGDCLERAVLCQAR